LYPGDQIQTYQRARASIVTRGARIHLMPRTRVIIPGVFARGTDSGLRLALGRVWVWLIGGRSVELGNDVAVASAHGTQFVVDAAEDGTLTVTVLEGTVAFGNAAGQVLVGADEQSSATRGVAPSRPVQVDPKGYLEWEASPEALWLPWERQPQAGDLAAQETTLRAALETAPGDSRAQLALGWNLLAQGRPVEAQDAFTAATRLAPANAEPLASAEPLVGQAIATAAAGGADNLQQAQTLLGKALAVNPNEPLAYLAQGLLDMRAGDAAGARRALQQALALDARLYQAYAYLATVDLAEKKVDAARQDAAQAVALAPASALARESLATVEFFSGDAAGARRDVDAALAANPSSPGAHLLSSDLHAQAGDLDQATDEALLAVTADPTLAPAWSALGFLALAQNDLRVADKAFTRALALAPHLVAARTGMGVTYARRGKLAQALNAQEGAVALDSSNLAAENNLGAVYLATGRLYQAEAVFKTVLAARPDWAVPHENLALTYLELQRYADAVREGELAVKLGADSPRAHTTLARVYLKQNRVNQAWAELRRALDLDDTFALAHLEIARVYTALGKSRDAREHQLRALTLEPGAIAESRQYAQNEIQAAAGSLFLDAKTDGRSSDGLNTYYADVQHQQDNDDRAHSHYDTTTALGMLGREENRDTVNAGYLSLERDGSDRPGQLLPDGTAQDPDSIGHFTAGEFDYLARRSAGPDARWTWKLGYLGTAERDKNPDALTAADPSSFRETVLQSQGPSAEGRYDRTRGPRDSLIAGVAVSGDRQEVGGTVGMPAPGGGPVTWTPFANWVNQPEATGYLWRQWQAGHRLALMVGGRMATREGMTPVLRPEAYVRQGVGRRGTVILLSRAVLADDVSELSPVNDWALRDWLSPLNLARGGFSQSNEFQYELLPAGGGLLRLSLFQRSLKNFLVNLADPQWSAGAAAVVVGSGSLTGGEIEAEKPLTRSLSAALWWQFASSENNDAADKDLPYQPADSGYLRLDYLGESGVRSSLIWQYTGKRFADLANATQLGGYSQVNLRADWQRNLHTDWFVTVNNLFNQDYAFYQYYPSAGAKAEVGIDYRW
jgi:Tfp pilus assembly protein PilF